MIYNFRLLARSLSVTALVVLAILTATGVASARPVTRSQARIAADSWLASNASSFGVAPDCKVRHIKLTRVESTRAAYYVALLEPSGFLILSADDSIEPVIAFSGNSDFHSDGLKPLLTMLSRDVSSRTEQVRVIERRLHSTRTPAQADSRTAHARQMWLSLLADTPAERDALSVPHVSGPRVDPFLETEWGQTTAGGHAVYNYYCPPGAPGDATNYPVGCGAAALAQIMRYFQYPVDSVGLSSFGIRVDGVAQSRSLRGGDGSGGPYRWDLMSASPDELTSLASRQAIGAVCHDAGVSIETHYSADSSSSVPTEIAQALTATYGYSSAVSAYNAGSEIGSALANIVNPNLDASSPVMLAIDGHSGGHGVLADGYGYHNGLLYHHLNMGWGGPDNAWYNLPVIDGKLSAFTTIYACVYNVFPKGHAGEIISGRVLDALNRPMEGAAVTATRVGGGTYSALTNDRGIYALTHLPSASDYSVTASKKGYVFADTPVKTGTSVKEGAVAGNVWGITLQGSEDTSPPAVRVEQAIGQADPTNASPINFTITFSADVLDFAAEDVTILGTAGATAASVTGSGSDYKVTVSGMSRDGTVVVSVGAGSAHDSAGRPNTASTSVDNTVTYDTTGPSVSFAKPASSGYVDRIGSKLRIEGTASDPSGIAGVTWALNGASGNCSGGTSWSADDLELSIGENVVTVAATDRAGNSATASLTANRRDDSPAGWNGLLMVGIPVVPDIPDPLPVVGFARDYWLTYLPASAAYLTYAPLENASWLSPAGDTPGRGFWAYFDAAAPPPSGTLPAQDRPASIHLSAGWNLISNPFLKSVTWDVDLVKVRVGESEAVDLRDSTSVVADYLWGWTQDDTDKSTGSYYLVADPTVIPGAAAVLEPWVGYWIKAAAKCELVIPAP